MSSSIIAVKGRRITVDNSRNLASVGDVVYLIEIYNENTGRTTYAIQHGAGKTNLSHEVAAPGVWLGSWNNIGYYNAGRAMVIGELETDGLVAVRLIDETDEEFMAAATS